MIEIAKVFENSRFLNVKIKQYKFSALLSAENSTNFVDPW